MNWVDEWRKTPPPPNAGEVVSVQWSADYVNLGEATSDRPAGWYLVGTPQDGSGHRYRLRVQDSPDRWWGDTAHGLVALLGPVTVRPRDANGIDQ